ncbi:protein-L-isoaspartate(D-aspartate) O-methyltransferase [Mycetocola miduiensis]|uniref:Protein-L-isoaspartate O-methyltransferase n=1 Tax=Mycetocola miduiensis TaxID=995034 RepID=A0A1I5DNX4_9MICO|nr:protein-L-isoaspartate(D-aspartate) O-methyltransferase [Mycetocola miduiensis]SFO00923.1 protein-L-isoaspartate(D-aspartate) O-methyltransferase [Mycetocola miduiensis]
MDHYRSKRERMVAEQIAARGIRDSRVLDAMRRVPREEFVRRLSRSSAYEDHPLAIASGQTISQPYIVALTVEAALVDERSHVLDVGTGSGYGAAVLAEIVADVVSIERHPELANGAREVLERLGYSTVSVVTGDGTLGWPDAAPYDAIVVAAAAARVPGPWLEQLKDGGRLVMPVGTPGFGQRLQRITLGPGRVPRADDLGGVTFVPLIGAYGIGSPLFEENDD